MLVGGIGAATVLLTGCDAIDDVLGSGDDPGVSGAVTPTAPPADADSSLVESVLASISTTGALAAATASAVPEIGTARYEQGGALRTVRFHEVPEIGRAHV